MSMGIKVFNEGGQCRLNTSTDRLAKYLDGKDIILPASQAGTVDISSFWDHTACVFAVCVEPRLSTDPFQMQHAVSVSDAGLLTYAAGIISLLLPAGAVIGPTRVMFFSVT